MDASTEHTFFWNREPGRDWSFSCRSNSVTRLRVIALIGASFHLFWAIFMIGFALNSLTEVAFVDYIWDADINSFHIVSYAEIFMALVIFTIFPIALFSIILFNRKLMRTHAVVHIFLSFLCLCVLIGCYKLPSTNIDVYKHSMSNKYGHPSRQQLTEAVDTLHEKFGCCGAKSMMEWKYSEFVRNQSKWPANRVPNSCCTTCQTLHDSFCSEFLRGDFPENATQLTENHKLCLQGSEFCSNSSKSIVSWEMCQGHDIIGSMPKKLFIYQKGCYGDLSRSVAYFRVSHALIILTTGLLSILCSAFWMFIHVQDKQFRDSFVKVPTGY